nr:2-oxo acid dehydrogenase subunit E2 [Nostocaceae cyanobacterium]
ASPLARRMALEKGIALAQIKGTGPSGRITKEDVNSFKSVSSGAVVGADMAVSSFSDTPLSSMRKTIAKRLSESMFSAPHFYLHSSVNVSKLLKVRAALNAGSEQKVSINDLIVKAVASSIRKFPDVNVSYLEKEGVLRKYNIIDISVAVATPNGLLTPVVRNVGALGLTDISKQVKSLSSRARDGKLKPEEYTGGTFTISNMGMMGIDEFTAIVGDF